MKAVHTLEGFRLGQNRTQPLSRINLVHSQDFRGKRRFLPDCRSEKIKERVVDSSLKEIKGVTLNVSTLVKQTVMSRRLHTRRTEGVDKNVWVEFTQLAAEYNVVNLGQGFPDFPPPKFILEAFSNAIGGGFRMHQYTRAFVRQGHPRLVKILAKFFGRILGLEIDPMQDVLVTVGAYEALFCAFQALIEEGDEVIIMEPFFDCYESMTLIAGGKPVYIPLRSRKVSGSELSSADWVLCPEELASKFTPRTKAIVLNNPNNPLGKVFQREELQMIADLCIKHDVICISDEVYEWLTYDGAKHIKIASLPGMWERTVTVGSGGKSFSATGWKVGWAIGSSHILKHLQTVHQNSVYHCATPAQKAEGIIKKWMPSYILLPSFESMGDYLMYRNQEAVAVGFQREYNLLGTEESYFQQLPRQLDAKRLRLAECLKSIGLQPFLPEGGYFMITDISKLKVNLNDPSTKEELYDYRFVKWLMKEKGLGIIPVSSFYGSEHRENFQNYVRFCFVKEDSTLKSAEDIIRKWNETQ